MSLLRELCYLQYDIQCIILRHSCVIHFLLPATFNFLLTHDFILLLQFSHKVHRGFFFVNALGGKGGKMVGNGHGKDQKRQVQIRSRKDKTCYFLFDVSFFTSQKRLYLIQGQTVKQIVGINFSASGPIEVCPGAHKEGLFCLPRPDSYMGYIWDISALPYLVLWP